MGTKAIRQEVEATYEKVKSLAGWSVHKDVVLTIVSYFVASQKDFDAVPFSRSMDILKTRASLFSPLRGNLLPVMAAFLTADPDHMEEQADRLFERQKILRAAGFRNTIHSYLATFLMSDDENVHEQEARQAKQLYDAMKRQHFFLTSDDDYAYAMLLSQWNEDPKEHAVQMRAYYDALKKAGFKTGNELQWLSQILTMSKMEMDESVVKRTETIFETLKTEVKARPVHYPMIGFLTVFQADDRKIQDITALAKELEKSKILRFNREMALSIAIGYVLHSVTEETDRISISHAASVEMVLRAQQAVMAATVAAVAASSAASASSPGSQ